MSWFIELLTGNSIAHAVLIYAFVIATGVMLGKIKIAGISLGVTFVLFMGILVGHFLLKFMSIELVMLSNHLILCHTLLLLPLIFPSIKGFLMSRLFASGG